MVSAEAGFNRFVLQNEGRLFRSSYPKSFRDLVGKNGVITVHGEKQRKLHSIASNMMPLEKLRFHFLHDTQTVIRRTLLHGLQDGQVVPLQDVCRKVHTVSSLFLLLQRKNNNSTCTFILYAHFLTCFDYLI